MAEGGGRPDKSRPACTVECVFLLVLGFRMLVGSRLIRPLWRRKPDCDQSLTSTHDEPFRNIAQRLMNYSDILAQLKAASAFDLFRLRAAIDRALDEPAWMVAVQARLHVGQSVEYFDPQANASYTGQVLELRRKQAVVFNKETSERWLISYAAINLDGADVEIREKPREGLGRNEVAIGDRVGFVGRDGKERSGRIVRLNAKTVTLDCENQKWRVAYSFLHRVFDSDANLVAGVEILGPTSLRSITDKPE